MVYGYKYIISLVIPLVCKVWIEQFVTIITQILLVFNIKQGLLLLLKFMKFYQGEVFIWLILTLLQNYLEVDANMSFLSITVYHWLYHFKNLSLRITSSVVSFIISSLIIQILFVLRLWAKPLPKSITKFRQGL